MTGNILLYVQDIIEYIERVEVYTEGYDFELFLEDRKTCDSVLRCLEVIGEAAKKIPDEVRVQYLSVPWREMAGMRDKVIHGYFIVDFEMVWLVVKEDLPQIKPIIKQMLLEMQD